MVGFGYHYHKVVRESEARQLERRHEHARALKESPTRQVRRWPGIRESIVSLLLRWRPGSPRPAALRDPATGLGIDDHDLTDYVCRLADGSMGRVAIILGPDEEWTAVCVPA
jgi:hypothetical protein